MSIDMKAEFFKNSTYTIHILNYNFDPDPVLDVLSRQISDQHENIRIVVWDDGSSGTVKDYLLSLKSKYKQEFISWKLQKRNRGRAIIREEILQFTKSGWIICIDSDMIPDRDFIEQMLKALRDPQIIYRGIHYYQKYPPVKARLLHWNYGQQREVPSQNKNPYRHFSTAIFAGHQKVLNFISLDSNITGYGHEDTYLGLQLKGLGISIETSKMKALHSGLSINEIFTDKQLEAARNLKAVQTRYPDYANRLIKWANRINKIPVLKQLIIKNWVQNFFRKRLMKNPGMLFYLDVLKLSEYLRISFLADGTTNRTKD